MVPSTLIILQRCQNKQAYNGRLQKSLKLEKVYIMLLFHTPFIKVPLQATEAKLCASLNPLLMLTRLIFLSKIAVKGAIGTHIEAGEFLMLCPHHGPNQGSQWLFLK